LVRGGKLARQRLLELDARRLGLLLARTRHREVVDAENDKEYGEHAPRPLAVSIALDPQARERARSARRRRRIDEPALLERFHALRDDAVGHLDTLTLVERSQPLDQLLLPPLFVKLARDQHIAMT